MLLSSLIAIRAMLITNAYAQSSRGDSDKLMVCVESGSADPVSHLIVLFGERMSSSQVASALGYSHTYFIKKIGSQHHIHLDWVIALKPARVRMGRSTQYKTKAVALFMKHRGLL